MTALRVAQIRDMECLGPDLGKSTRARAWRDNAALGCVLIEPSSSGIRGATSLDVKQARFDLSGEVSARLLTATERLAARFGILELSCRNAGKSMPTLRAAGYQQISKTVLSRRFPRRSTHYLRRVRGLLEQLELPLDYARRYRLPLQDETTHLASIGVDVFGREQRMRPGAGRAWLAMQRRAAGQGVTLQAVSAFRSVNYQAGIVQRKRENGQGTTQILSTSAAPGFSEHHTGRALDITTPGFEVLEDEFEDSPAFAWLVTHAASHGFVMTFPRNNPHGVAFEPWHWAWWPVSAKSR